MLSWIKFESLRVVNRETWFEVENKNITVQKLERNILTILIY